MIHNISYLHMGGESSSEGLPAYEWTWLANENGLELYQEKQQQWIAEKRRITLDNRYSTNSEDEIYQYRRGNEDGLVRVYSAEVVEDHRRKETESICSCSSFTQMIVYSERIPYRLSEMPLLSFQEGLYLLRETLHSFDIIYQRIGPLHINP